MPIIVCLDKVMEKQKMSLGELAARIGITNVNLSRIKTGKVRAVRFSTLGPICEALDCQPGDILKHVSRKEYEILIREETGVVEIPGAEEPPPAIGQQDGGS